MPIAPMSYQILSPQQANPILYGQQAGAQIQNTNANTQNQQMTAQTLQAQLPYVGQQAYQNLVKSQLGNQGLQAGLPYIGPQAAANVSLTQQQANMLPITSMAPLLSNQLLVAALAQHPEQLQNVMGYMQQAMNRAQGGGGNTQSVAPSSPGAGAVPYMGNGQALPLNPTQQSRLASNISQLPPSNLTIPASAQGSLGGTQASPSDVAAAQAMQQRLGMNSNASGPFQYAGTGATGTQSGSSGMPDYFSGMVARMMAPSQANPFIGGNKDLRPGTAFINPTTGQPTVSPTEPMMTQMQQGVVGLSRATPFVNDYINKVTPTMGFPGDVARISSGIANYFDPGRSTTGVNAQNNEYASNTDKIFLAESMIRAIGQQPTVDSVNKMTKAMEVGGAESIQGVRQRLYNTLALMQQQENINKNAASNGINVSQTPSGAAPAGQSIRVRSPDGRTGTIPASALSNAMQNGYQRI